MNDAVATPEARPRTEDTRESPDAEDLRRLRELLLGPEQRHLRAIQARLDDPAAMARDLGRALPDVIARGSGDPRLSKALAPAVEDAIMSSVRRDPQPLAAALFPVLGPAIRQAIGHALGAMVDSLNRVVEQSVSWRALGWRLTAWRTGTSYAEVVLLNTLVYRVEQVFLIHRETGLLLLHVAVDPSVETDATMVSAMLTAIGDFVHDSFGSAEGEAVDTLRVGDRSVFVAQGPVAFLAAVVRGTPPATLQTVFQDALETIHLQHSADLDAFTGDARAFADARPLLRACLVSQTKAAAARGGAWRWWALAAVVLIAVVAWWSVDAWRDRQRWTSAVSLLKSQPGMVIVASKRRGGRYEVTGMRDPLAANPAAVLRQAGIDTSDIDLQWQLYQALEPSLVEARARAVLQPPAGVTLALDGGTLRATGAAPVRWTSEAGQVARAIAGVERFDASGVSDPALTQLVGEIEGASVRFLKGTTQLAPGQAGILDALLGNLKRLDQMAAGAGRQFGVAVVGHADSDGSPDANLPLSRARAEEIRDRARAAGLGALRIEAQGVGSQQPLAQGPAETDKQRNRRVSVRVSLAGVAGTGARSQ
jgi:OOP family OmpA-OmpF porin